MVYTENNIVLYVNCIFNTHLLQSGQCTCNKQTVHFGLVNIFMTNASRRVLVCMECRKSDPKRKNLQCLSNSVLGKETGSWGTCTQRFAVGWTRYNFTSWASLEKYIYPLKKSNSNNNNKGYLFICLCHGNFKMCILAFHYVLWFGSRESNGFWLMPRLFGSEVTSQLNGKGSLTDCWEWVQGESMKACVPF